MKKILFALVALMCSMSMNGQIMKVTKNGETVAIYKGAEYAVTFDEERPFALFYFPTTEEMSLDMESTNPYTEKNITVSRYDSTNNYPATTVGISVLENTNDVYTVPTTLAFGEGETEATLTVGIGALTLGEHYDLSITFEGENFDPEFDIMIAGEEITPGAGYTYAMRIYSLGWSETKTGVWVDGFIDDWFGTGQVPFYVDYQIEWRSGGIQRIHARDVYSRAGNYCTPDEYGIYEAFPDIVSDELLEGTYDLLIDINPNNMALLQQCELGFDWGYGNMVVRSVNNAYGTWDGEHLFFSGEGKTLATKMPEYNSSFYYCGSDVDFFASRDAFVKSDLYAKINSTSTRRYIKQARKIRR